MAPDYGGYGASWRKSLYRNTQVTVPEILQKIAGPVSTVRQRVYPALSGMGADNPLNEFAAVESVNSAAEVPYADPSGQYDMDPELALPGDNAVYGAGADPIAQVTVWDTTPYTWNPEPTFEAPTAEAIPQEGLSIWPLLLLIGGIVLLSKKERK